MLLALSPVLVAAIDPTLAAIGSFLAAVVGAYVSIKLVRPRQQQIVATAGNIDSERWDRLMERYEHVVKVQDDQLKACHVRIDELESAERECEDRADALQNEIAALKTVLREHGIPIPAA